MLTEQMLEDRKQGIMGSMAAIIAGVARWGDLHWLYHSLIGSPTKPIVETIMMSLGNFLEPFIAVWYAEQTGYKLQNVRRTIWHKKHKFIGGHPDRIIRGDRNRGLEIKCVFQRAERDWENGPPLYYIAQIKHYALCTGRLKWDFAVLFMAHGSLKIFSVEFTKDDVQALCDQEVAFWNEHVLARNEPDVTHLSTDTLKQIWKTSDPEKTVVADEATQNYVEERNKLDESIKLFKDQKELVENKIRVRMQDGELLVASGGETLTTYKTNKRGNRCFNFKKEGK